jgi:hypothetical protein
MKIAFLLLIGMIFQLIFGVIDFLKFLLPLAIIMFVVYKLFFPLKEKISDRFEFSWVKSCLLLNLITIFILLFAFYAYFAFIGTSLALPTEVELQHDFVETIALIGFAVVRILIVSIIFSLALLFFEFFASFIITLQKEKEYSDTLKEFVGVLCSSALFLFLFLFIFNWVILGVFVYIFYGVVSELPLLTIINV